MHLRSKLFSFLPIFLLGLVPHSLAHATPLFSANGTFTADNGVFEYGFNTAAAQNFTFSTSSYAAGGFVPVLTLFSSDGSVVGFDGADGLCRGSATPGSSGVCDDAFLQEALTPGTYTLALTEFPNVAIGTLANGFLFAANPHITGDLCGVTGGTFLQTDTATCNQRTGNYNFSVDATAVTPELPTGLLVLAPALLLFAYSRRQLA